MNHAENKGVTGRAEVKPSEAINLALESKLEAIYGSSIACTISTALTGSGVPRSAVGAFLDRYLGAFESYTMFNPEDWGNPSVDSLENYAAYQVNKAFFLMVLLEYLLDNPEEDTFYPDTKKELDRAK